MKKNSVLKSGGASSGGLRWGSGVGLVGIGKFWLLAFLLVLGATSKTHFCVQCLKNDFFKKGLKNECFPGFDGSNQKKSKLNQRQKGTFWSLFKIDWRRIWGVIGNKYAKRCLLTMPSLVTNGRKGAF